MVLLVEELLVSLHLEVNWLAHEICTDVVVVAVQVYALELLPEDWIHHSAQVGVWDEPVSELFALPDDRDVLFLTQVRDEFERVLQRNRVEELNLDEFWEVQENSLKAIEQRLAVYQQVVTLKLEGLMAIAEEHHGAWLPATLETVLHKSHEVGHLFENFGMVQDQLAKMVSHRRLGDKLVILQFEAYERDANSVAISEVHRDHGNMDLMNYLVLSHLTLLRGHYLRQVIVIFPNYPFNLCHNKAGTG